MGPLDTHQLYGLATRLDEHAEAITRRGRRLAQGVQALDWHSPAADVFRAAVGARVSALDAAAVAIADAAHALRVHARLAQAEQNAVLAAARAAQVAARDAERLGQATVGASAAAATAAVRGATGALDRLGGLLP